MESQVSTGMSHTKNGTNHEETSFEMNHYIDKPCRMILRVAMHLLKHKFKGTIAFSGWF